MSKIVDYQVLLLDKYQDSPVLPNALHNFEQMLQILQRNQLNYNTTHEGYLQNQLNLIRTNELPTDISNKLDDVSLGKQLNASILEAQAVLPVSPQLELPTSLDSSPSQLASSIPTQPTISIKTEEFPQVSSPFNEDIPLRKEPNGSVPTTKIVEPVVPTSQDVSTLPKRSLLQQVIITSEPINNSVGTVSVPSIPTTSPEPVNNSVKAISAPSIPTTSPDISEDNTPSNSVDLSGFSNRLLEVVSDKTGYPVDMLDINMDLEADLGIDSIKQLEIFAAMHEEYPDMDVDPELFRDLRTLAKIVEHLEEHLSKNQAKPSLDNGKFDQELGIERQVVKKKF
jgi:acyl carrier protein